LNKYPMNSFYLVVVSQAESSDIDGTISHFENW